MSNLVDEADLYRAFLTALNEEITKRPESVLKQRGQDSVTTVRVPAPTSTRTVFIIHGRDEVNLLRLRQLLQDRWDLPSIVLKEKPGKGRTLIEKFEEEAQAATFAVALFSPDDMVKGKGPAYPQARPNVIFELGWFYGRLRRDRVCILLRQGTEIHSDLEGISRIEFKESIEEKVSEIERELTEAGLV